MSEINLNLKVAEESKVNATFASLRNLLQLHSIHIEDPKFLSRDGIINVDENGDLSFKQQFDLENICVTKQICCGVEQCFLNLDIPLNSRMSNLIDSIRLQLEIIDKNDNKPVFSKEQLFLSISESAPIGTQMLIEPAIDRDFNSINRIHSHRLIEQSNTFHLQTDKEKSNVLIIQLNKELDYEIKTEYLATLLACDPDFCTNQTIVILVRDVNDNVPKFVTNFYNVTIKETTPIGNVILKVAASDLDKSENYSKIHYVIDSKIDLNILSTFKLDESTGSIIVQQELNAKIRNQYKFHVKARDSSNGGNFDTATVVINVKDENNCAPVIDILYPSDRRIVILENRPPQQIAIISVIDNDVGINSMLSCELRGSPDNENFSLKAKSRDLFTIHSLKQFDYEKKQDYFIQIRCSDFGTPSLTTVNSFKISVIDENEYGPEFSQSHYRAFVRENTSPYSQLMQITAFDKDKNATLRYKFINKTTNAHMTLDPVTGWISTSEINIDREELTQILLTVVVTDTLGPDSKSASSTVTFHIKDENDNKPKFTETFSFKLSENVVVDTYVGRVWATDADEGGANSLKYSLLKTWSSKQKEISDMFIVKADGNVQTKGDIDRELDDSFTLLIAVTDDEYMTRDYVKTNVTVQITDENDNAPFWLIPNTPNTIFNITKSYKIGDQVIQLVAEDRDVAENGELQYTLIPNNADNELSSKYFFVNSTNGGIFVINQLTETEYKLHILASDNGRPTTLSSPTVLIFNIYGNDAYQLKVAVVATMIIVTGIISVFLIIAIICVRKHPQKRLPIASESNFTENDDTFLKSKAMANSQLQTPDFLNLLGSDNSNSVQIPMLQQYPHRHINEYLDADSGDSGNGPSEEGLSSYLNDGKAFLRTVNQSGINYTPSSFIPGGLYPHSCYSLPENTVIPQLSDEMLSNNLYYDLSSTASRNFNGILQKTVTNTNDYPLQNLYSQLSQI